MVASCSAAMPRVKSRQNYGAFLSGLVALT